MKLLPSAEQIVRCGRSNAQFAGEPLLAERWCILDAGHAGIHIAGKHLSIEREVERYNDERAAEQR